MSCSASFVSQGLLDSENECRKLGRRCPLLCRGFGGMHSLCLSFLCSTSTLPIGVTVDLYWGIFIYYPWKCLGSWRKQQPDPDSSPSALSKL